MLAQIKKHLQRSDKYKALFVTMLVFGVFGLIASFTLSVEEFYLLKNPEAVLSCSFNIVLNCSTVMKTWQASLFGFPNMFMGLMGYPVVIMIALLGLSNVKFPRWFTISMQAGATLAVLFAFWLFFTSLYSIQALCPWCLIVTVSTTIIWTAVTRYSLRENTFILSKKNNKTVQAWLGKDYDKLAIAIWLVLLVSLVIVKFGSDLVT